MKSQSLGRIEPLPDDVIRSDVPAIMQRMVGTYPCTSTWPVRRRSVGLDVDVETRELGHENYPSLQALTLAPLESSPPSKPRLPFFEGNVGQAGEG